MLTCFILKFLPKMSDSRGFLGKTSFFDNLNLKKEFCRNLFNIIQNDSCRKIFFGSLGKEFENFVIWYFEQSYMMIWLRKKLCRNVFIANLALSDLCLCAVTMPLTFMEVIYHHHHCHWISSFSSSASLSSSSSFWPVSLCRHHHAAHVYGGVIRHKLSRLDNNLCTIFAFPQFFFLFLSSWLWWSSLIPMIMMNVIACGVYDKIYIMMWSHQVVYQRWQWGDSSLLCHLQAPLQVRWQTFIKKTNCFFFCVKKLGRKLICWKGGFSK